MEFQVKQISSLSKVYLDGKGEFYEIKKARVLKGERYSYQIAYKTDERFTAKISVESELEKYITVRAVEMLRRSFLAIPTKHSVRSARNRDFFLTCFIPCVMSILSNRRIGSRYG